MDQIARSLMLTAAVLTVTLLGGCSLFRKPGGAEPQAPPQAATPASSTAGAPSATIPPAPPASPAQPSPPVRSYRLSPASRSLVEQAHAQVARGDLPGASSSLDRAVRIEPSNPLLWIEQGRLRLAENDAHQAESCGRKALALASGDRSAQAESARLLADALRAQNRNVEAQEVERQLVR